MVLKVVLLDNHENFIKFLNPELISLEETSEKGQLRTVSVSYWVEDFEMAKKEFKMGNKLWISGDKKLTDYLYVINTSLERDYFDENNISFEAEDVLAELNYAPLFCQTDLKSSNGFNVTDTGVVTVDRNALGLWFGDYFNIGIFQNALHDKDLKILPKGTMNLMDLLRFIESESGNVFLPRYAKDDNSNVIHRYLDFLNPKDGDKTWDLVFDYNFHLPEESSNVGILYESEGVLDTEHVQYEENDAETEDSNETLPEWISSSDLKLRIIKDGKVLVYKDNENYLPLDFDAPDLGLTGDDTEYELTLTSYIHEDDNVKNPCLCIKVVAESYDENNDDVTSTTTINRFEVDLPNDIEIQLYTVDKIVFNYKINTLLGKLHKDVLDLGYNTENINYEIVEDDTFNAIAPILTSDSLNHAQLNTLVQRWVDLEITKGAKVPMIIQKISDSSNSHSSTPSNYWSKPIKPQDSNNSYEWWRGTAYWKAPFNKKGGEVFVVDDEDTGIDYNEIFRRKDIDFDSDVESSSPKIGTVETSEEDPYAIFNAVCMKLKEKRYPELNIDFDVANYINDKANSYDLYDKVQVKIPTFDNIITATVSKTIKNAHDIGTNKVELSNYSINAKTEQIETELTASKITDFKYPKKKNFTVTLKDIDGNPLPNQYISIELLKVENESASSTGKVYSPGETNENGQITITMKYDPGEYQFKINYGGTEGYESCELIVNFKVGGKKEIYIEHLTGKKGSSKVKTKRLVWDKYGASPKAKHITSRKTVELLKSQSSNGNLIMAIGKAVTGNDKKTWGNNLILTIFEKKCARCGSTKLYWGYKWNGNHDKGLFKPTKTVEPGALTGRIICAKCGTSYDVTGKAGNRRLKVKQVTGKTNKNTLKKLQSGSLWFGKKEILISTKKAENTGTVITRSSSPGSSVSGVVKSKVKKRAKDIVDGKSGVKAAKELAKWISKNIKNEDREGLYQSPSRTLIRKKGNSLCKIDLFLHMCDACGVQRDGISCYYVYMHKKKTSSKKKIKRKKKNKTTNHMIARVNGKWVDVTMKNPWGHHKTGFGALKNAKIYRYPNLPITRKYG